jgi:hypothetical protein
LAGRLPQPHSHPHLGLTYNAHGPDESLPPCQRRQSSSATSPRPRPQRPRASTEPRPGHPHPLLFWQTRVSARRQLLLGRQRCCFHTTQPTQRREQTIAQSADSDYPRATTVAGRSRHELDGPRKPQLHQAPCTTCHRRLHSHTNQEPLCPPSSFTCGCHNLLLPISPRIESSVW